MDPITTVAVISTVSALAQAYQSEKARGANRQRLKELEDAFNKIAPPDYDISINDPPKYIEGALEGANLDFSRLTPKDFKTIGTYAPQSAEFVREQRPELAEMSAEGKEGRQSQLDALRKYKSIAKGDSPELQIRLQQAADRAQQEAQQRSQSALLQAQRQGRGGSGLTFAAALQGSSDAMQSGAMQGQNAALAAYQSKLDAIRNEGQMGRQLAQDDLSQQSRNADVINAFNERTSRNYQAYLNQRANMVNDAQRYNLEQRQRTADMNTRQGNEADRYNLENRNRLLQQDYENRRGERNYQNELAYNKAAWGRDEKARQNQLRSQRFNDQMNIQRSKQGLAGMAMDMDTQQAADRNQMIQGLGNAGTAYYTGQMQRQDAQKAQEQEQARWERYMEARFPKGRNSAFQPQYDDYDDYRGYS
jgi:hypothetical protein